MANESSPEIARQETIAPTVSTKPEINEARPVLGQASKAISQPAPKISISPRTASSNRAASASIAQPASKQKGSNSIEIWEDKTLSSIFKITLKDGSKQGSGENPSTYLPGIASELKDEGSAILLHTGILDQAILEAVSSFSEGKPLRYLLGCWKRVSRLLRAMRVSEGDDPKYRIVKEARRLCMSYCIFAMTIPEMFGIEDNEGDALAGHLLADPDSEDGICHDFYSEAIARFPEDDTVKGKLVESIEQLSLDLAKISMNEDYKPYVRVRNPRKYTFLTLR